MLSRLLSAQMYLCGGAARAVTVHSGCFFLNRIIKVPYGRVMVLGHRVPCRGHCLCKGQEMGEPWAFWDLVRRSRASFPGR